MPNAKNQEQVAILKDKITTAKSAAIVDYQGVTVNEMTDLRAKLRETNSEFLVTKNTLISLAFDKDSAFDTDLNGMNGLILSYEDEVSALKVAFEFHQDTEKLVIKSGWLDGAAITADQVEALSKIPGKKELIATLINRLQSPAYGLVNVLNASTRDLVNVLKAIADKPAA